MKRIPALMLALILLFTLAACGGTENPPTDTGAAGTGENQTEQFVKPENYASVLLVTINPQLRLYLDANGTVLAVEAVNEDAVEIAENISFSNQSVDSVVEKIVTAANEKGLIKEENATIHLSVTETTSQQASPAEILNKAQSGATRATASISIPVSVQTEDKTASQQQSSSEPTDSATSDTTQTESSDSPAPHTHSYSDATCTAPKTCSCGATEGTALGHDYKNGTCSRCNTKDPNFVSYTSVTQKNGSWTAMFLDGETLYDTSFLLYGDAWEMGYGLGDPLTSLPEEVQEDMKADCTLYNGNYYYFGRGGGGEIAALSEEGTTVTLTDESGNQLVLTRTGEDALTVKTSPSAFGDFNKIPEGIVLTFTNAS